MSISLLDYRDLGTYSVPFVDLNQFNTVHCGTGRVLVYAWNFRADILVVNPDYTSTYVPGIYGTDNLPQIVPMGHSGTTDYVAMIRDVDIAATGIVVDLWSIDASNNFTLEDTLTVATDDPNMNNSWAQPSTDTSFLLPYSWFDSSTSTTLGRLTSVTRTGTTLSCIAPIDSSDNYFGSFDSSIKTGISSAWLFNYGTNTFDLIDDATLSVVSSVSSATSNFWSYSNDETTGNGMVFYQLTAGWTIADFSTTGIVDVHTFSTSDGRFIDCTYDNNGNQYLLFRDSTTTAPYPCHLYGREPGDPDYTLIDTVTTTHADGVTLCRFKDGVAVLDSGNITTGNADGVFLYYYGSGTGGGTPPTPPTNDNKANPKVLNFPYGSLTTETGSLAYANGLDATGTTRASYSNVWFYMVVPDGQHGLIQFQVDHVTVPTSVNFTANIWNGTASSYSSSNHDSNGAPLASYQTPVLSATPDYTVNAARLLVNAGDIITIEVSRDVAGTTTTDTDFVLRASFYSYATSPYSSDRAPLPDGTVAIDRYYFGLAEVWDNRWFGSSRGAIAELNTAGGVILNATIDPRVYDLSSSVSLGAISEGYGRLFADYGYSREVSSGAVLPFGSHILPTPIDGGLFVVQDGFSGIQFSIYDVSFQLQARYEVGGSDGVYGTSGDFIVSKGNLFFIGDDIAVNKILVRVDLSTGSVRTASLGMTGANPYPRRLYARDDGMIIVLIEGFSISVNYFDTSMSSLVWDPVTMTQVGTISWSNAPYSGYMTMASGYSAQLDNALNAWGFSTSTYFGANKLPATADGAYAVSSTLYPSTDVVYAGGASWGYEYRSSVFKTDLHTGATSLWVHVEHPRTDVHGPDPTQATANDRRYFYLVSGCPDVYPYTLARGSGDNGIKRVVFDI